jgi:hypothetical protein
MLYRVRFVYGSFVHVITWSLFHTNYINFVTKLQWLCVFTFWVPCCDIRYNFRIKKMFGLSLPPVVCRRRMSDWRFCFVFLRLVYRTLCNQFLWIVVFFIAPSVFSNVYLHSISTSIITGTSIKSELMLFRLTLPLDLNVVLLFVSRLS